MISEFFTPSLDEESAFATLNTTAHKLAHYSSGASFPFNFYLLQPNASCGGDCFRKHIDAWMENLEPGMWPNHVVTSMTSESCGSVHVYQLTLMTGRGGGHYCLRARLYIIHMR